MSSLALREPRPLLRQRPFRRLWIGESVSFLGDQVSLLALPLLGVLTLDASAAEMGLLTALGWAPHLLFSLFAGTWIDLRARRRPIMVAADLGRAALLTSIPLAGALGALTIAQLYAVTFGVGVLTVFFDLCWSSFLVAVVPRDQLVDANSKLMISRSASNIAGPSLAGGLVQALGAPVAVLVDAVSFLVSALFLRSIDVDELPLERREDEGALHRLREGVAFLLRHPVLRAGVACTSTLNFFTYIWFAIFVLYASRELGLSAGAIGLILGVGAVGGLFGALVAARLGRRIGIGPAIVLGAVLFPAPTVLFPLASGPQWARAAFLLAGEFVASVGVMVFDVNQNSLNVLLTPHRLRARIAGASRFFNYGTRPLGALAGGALGEAIGLRTTIWVGVAGSLFAVLFLLVSPMPSIREPPSEAPA
jgi:predicted MFS family arabinose efflux permease